MRRRPSTSLSATGCLPTMPMMPHMVRSDPWLDEVRYADARRRGRKVLDVARHENAAMFLRGGEDQRGAQPDLRPLEPQVGRPARDLRRNLADREVSQETLGLIPG